jgi:hypothetical protein
LSLITKTTHRGNIPLNIYMPIPDTPLFFCINQSHHHHGKAHHTFHQLHLCPMRLFGLNHTRLFVSDVAGFKCFAPLLLLVIIKRIVKHWNKIFPNSILYFCIDQSQLLEKKIHICTCYYGWHKGVIRWSSYYVLS